MPRLESGESTAVDLNNIEAAIARNRTDRRIMVEFQYLGTDMRWHEISFIYLERRGSSVTVAREELITPGMRAESQVRVGISGPERGEDADVDFRR